MTPWKYIGRWFDPKGKTSVQTTTTTTTTHDIHYNKVYFYQPFPVLSHFRTRSPLLRATSLTTGPTADRESCRGQQENAKCTFNELGKLLDDEAGCPIMYNHYYTDSIQKACNKCSKQDLCTSLNNAIVGDWNGCFHVTKQLS